MNKIVSRTLTVLCVALAAVLLGTVSVAQSTFHVGYYVNAQTPGVPDATLRINNPGSTYENLCAMIYVFTADQQMAECCGCLESPDNLNTLSVNNDLTANPLTSTIPTAGVIKIVSAAVNGAPCDPTKNVWPNPTEDPVWLTHWVDDLNILGEDLVVKAVLSVPELVNLQSQCSFINILGSGHGICTCGSGSSSPVKKKK